jgi:UDP-3-O-[3-hydroxymyristoyl] glucosamine N-acyltransferase
VTTLGALAEAIGGSLEGDPDIPIHGVRSPEAAGPSDIAVLLDRRAPKEPLRAGALVVGGGTRPPAPHPPLVVVANPRRAFAVLLSVFHPPRAKEPGVQPGAHVSPRASVDPTAHVAAGATVEAGAVLEARVEVHAGAYVGEGVVVGEESVLFPNAVLYEGTRVGRRVRIHAGAVVGSDGFGYERDEKGRQMKVPQAGGVVLGDDVEIGANAAIDRATLETTVIGAGTKIDNLVQIGHNTQIGEHCCLVGQSGVSGSVTIGDFAVVAGQAGIADHAVIGKGVVVGAQCGVPGDLDAGVWLGTPAMLATTARRVFPAVARLPETVKRVKELEERCARLEARLESLLAEARERR